MRHLVIKIFLILIIWSLCDVNTSYCQNKPKFKDLPLELQNSINSSLQKILIGESLAVNSFSDTISIGKSPRKDTSILIKYIIEIKNSDLTIFIEPIKVDIYFKLLEIRVNGILDPDLNEQPMSLNVEKPAMSSKLNFICKDHNPRHSAITLKEMKKLQEKYHCKEIAPFIIDD